MHRPVLPAFKMPCRSQARDGSLGTLHGAPTNVIFDGSASASAATWCASPLPTAQLLTHPQMPEEFNFDPDIMELKEEIKGMQQEFIELHKNSDAIKNLSK